MGTIHDTRGWRPLLATILASATMLVAPIGAGAATVSNHLKFSFQFGWQVNETAGLQGRTAEEGICPYPGHPSDACRSGAQSGEAGGFKEPLSVAVYEGAKPVVYVADSGNQRVDEFEADGKFVLTFGREVNETARLEGRAAEEDVCPYPGHPADSCQAGATGSLAGQFNTPMGVAVDQSTGDIYVADRVNFRVQKFTPSGEFVSMIGGEVNETAKLEGRTSEENVCPYPGHPADSCQTGVHSPPSGRARGQFQVWYEAGDVLAVGGPKDLLYVGDEERVQEFGASGIWEGELPLTRSDTPSFPAESKVTGLAVDGAGDLYVTESQNAGANLAGHTPPGVYEFAPGATVASKALDTSSAKIEALALDPSAPLLAVIDEELLREGGIFELSQEGGEGPRSEFSPPSPSSAGGRKGLAFNAESELYAADWNNEDVQLYVPAPVAALTTDPCTERTTSGLTLNGFVDPNGVPGTEAWFQYGPGSPPPWSETPRRPIGAAEPIAATLTKLLPNETYQYRVAAYDANNPEGSPAKPAPPLTSETLTCKTRALPPVIAGKPSASAGATFTSALLSASIDPENANTVYRFQYGPCSALETSAEQQERLAREEALGCPGELETSPLESAALGEVAVQQTASELQPSTTYRYRLVGNDSFEYGGEPEGGETVGEEGEFTTGPAPTVEALTGPPSLETPTSATVSGSVNPDGFQATYAFELGVYNGAATQYGVVFSGPAGAGTGMVAETLALSGLQPGTTYAYRITIHSGYGEAVGAVQTFTTLGLPSVLTIPAVLRPLPVPPFEFPNEAHKPRKCKHGFRRNGHGKCVKVRHGHHHRNRKHHRRNHRHSRKGSRKR